MFDAGGALSADLHRPLAAGHAEALVPAIAALMAGTADRPQRIIVEIGPGSFTGLRVGIAAARALGLAWSAPVAGVRSTLLVAAAAHLAGTRGEALVALRAPRGQVWMETIDLATLVSRSPPQALEPAPAADRMARAGLVLGSAVDPAATPRASAASALRLTELGEPLPLYVRTPAA